MATSRDYYEILGVTKSASDAEIKKAYRTLARKYHPDVHKEADGGERFKEINEAYQVLSDPQKKVVYDQYGHSAFNQGPSGSTTSWGNDFDFGNFRDPFEIFEEFFGSRSPFGFSGGARSSRYSGEDLHFELTSSFKEAVFGTSKDISLERLIHCSGCKSSGVAKGSKKITCDKCGGRGVVQRSANSIFGNIITNTTCDKCAGSGQIPEKQCPKCKGKTLVFSEERRTIKIPAGVDDGSVIRYQGIGNAGPNGGDYGDLYLTIRVLGSKEFRRIGQEIHSELKINIVQASLGDELSVETVDGGEKINIPPGSQPGEQIRLKGKGVPSVNGYGRGDQVVTLKIEIPRHLSAKQKDLLKQFES